MAAAMAEVPQSPNGDPESTMSKADMVHHFLSNGPTETVDTGRFIEAVNSASEDELLEINSIIDGNFTINDAFDKGLMQSEAPKEQLQKVFELFGPSEWYGIEFGCLLDSEPTAHVSEALILAAGHVYASEVPPGAPHRTMQESIRHVVENVVPFDNFMADAILYDRRCVPFFAGAVRAGLVLPRLKCRGMIMKCLDMYCDDLGTERAISEMVAIDSMGIYPDADEHHLSGDEEWLHIVGLLYNVSPDGKIRGSTSPFVLNSTHVIHGRVSRCLREWEVRDRHGPWESGPLAASGRPHFAIPYTSGGVYKERDFASCPELSSAWGRVEQNRLKFVEFVVDNFAKTTSEERARLVTSRCFMVPPDREADTEHVDPEECAETGGEACGAGGGASAGEGESRKRDRRD